MWSAARVVAAEGGRQAHPQCSVSRSPTALLQLPALRRSLSARCPVKEYGCWLVCTCARMLMSCCLLPPPHLPHSSLMCFRVALRCPWYRSPTPTLRLLRCRSLDPVADRLTFCLAPFRLCLFHTQACAPCICTAEVVGWPKAALAVSPFPCRGEAFVLLLRVCGSSCATALVRVGWAAPLLSPCHVLAFLYMLSRLRCEPLSVT